MAKKMKDHPHRGVLFCTFSVQKGLLLPANPRREAIIKSCLDTVAPPQGPEEREKLDLVILTEDVSQNIRNLPKGTRRSGALYDQRHQFRVTALQL